MWRIWSSASRIVTLYRLAVTVPRTSLEQMMFFWLWSESMRRTSTRLASLTWISTVPSSETLTSDLLTLRPSVLDGAGDAEASGAAASGVDGASAPLALGLSLV